MARKLFGGYPVKYDSTLSDDAFALSPTAGTATTARSLGGISRKLLSGAALAALLVTGSVAAQADESNAELAAEIHALKTQLRHLEGRVEKQRVVIHQVQVKANTFQANAAVPYEPPAPWDKKFHMNGLTITPGGFLAMEGVYRTHDTGGDFSPAFSSIPNYTKIPGHENEIRGTARQSRFSLLIQGNANPDTLISGYGEFDFLGASATANSTESNSYTPRVRHLYLTVDWTGEGLHLLAGQTWSLVTMNQNGITPRKEDIPVTIDGQYVAGFTWARQPQLRLVKDFGNGFWAGVSAEMPQTGSPCAGQQNGTTDPALSAPAPTTINGISQQCNQLGSGGTGVLNPLNNYSFNHIPDFVAKAAYEANIDGHALHLEGYGLYTDLYNYTYAGSTVTGFTGNHNDVAGWGGGGGFTFGLLPRWVDVQGSAMIGRGIGRYGSGQLTNATFSPNGALLPLPEVMFLGGAVVHATPSLDLYAYGGEERILSTDWSASTFGAGSTSGFGSPFADNSGCNILTSSACSTNVRDTWEITAGFWDKVYQGDFGSLRVGLQYAYIQDDLFPGAGHSASADPSGLPANSKVHYNDQEVYASVRYYPFDPPPPAPPVVAKY
jgi:hypothetical protein